MARVARERLQAYADVDIVHASFAAADLPSCAFDLVYVAAAFHWIDPDVKFVKTHALLQASGHLAIIYRSHVSDGQGDVFTKAKQPIYARYKEEMRAGAINYVPLRRQDPNPESVDKARCMHTHFATFPVVAHYSADEYVNLLCTYSPILSMAPEARRTLLEDIRQLIVERFYGAVFQLYAMSLQVAQKK